MAQVLYLGESSFSASDSNCDPNPVFCLSGCIIDDTTLQRQVEPALNRLTARFFGDQEAVPDLTQLTGNREGLVTTAGAAGSEGAEVDLPSLMSRLSMTVTAVAIRTERYRRRLEEHNLYWHTLPIVMERFCQFIKPNPDVAKMKALSRGGELDGLLESEYQRVTTQGTDRRMDWEFMGIRGLTFSMKEENLAGLQISELIAYIIARHVSTLDGSDGLFDVVKGKLFGGRYGRKGKYGLRVLPKTELNYVD
ncbi:MAG: hypothetical protein M1358_22170 [Chloroflexi bacterium]|nr:hypothetical protein [Chloroflexota bacterium]